MIEIYVGGRREVSDNINLCRIVNEIVHFHTGQSQNERFSKMTRGIDKCRTINAVRIR